MVSFEEFIGKGNKVQGEIVYPKNYITKKAIEFAKLCCIEQAKTISEKALLAIDGVVEKSNGQRFIVSEGNHYTETEVDIDKESILNAFDLDSIK